MGLLGGLGEGVGDCRGAVVLESGVLFGSPRVFLEGGVNYVLFYGIRILNILVTSEEPTSSHRDVCSVGQGIWEKSGQMHGETTAFWKTNGTFFWCGGGEGSWWSGCYPMKGPGHPGPVRSKGVPGWLTVEFVSVGGWLTHGDMAMDSCA